MDKYYEDKKRRGLILTLHDLNPKLPYVASDIRSGRPVCAPEGPSYWSHLSARFRTFDEQCKFVLNGYVDEDLGQRQLV